MPTSLCSTFRPPRAAAVAPPALATQPMKPRVAPPAGALVASVALAIAAGIGAPASAVAQRAPAAERARGPGVALTGERRFSPARLARLDSALQRYVDEGRVPGAVLLILRDGRVAHEVAVGWSDREAHRPMRPDALFRIASQTKALTTVAAMQLVEEGRLGLVDPVSRYIPQFARTTVAVRTDTGRAIVAARRAITIRDLLTHTAGISYGTDPLVSPLYQAQGLGPAAGFGWYTADKDEPVCATMERLASLPFVAQPGERFVYGYGTDLLGCILERVTGKPLDQVLRERITQPLGLRDSWFFVPPSEGARLTTVYASDSAGRAIRAPDGARGQGHYLVGPRRNFAGGAGLVSTARDYARFLEALRRGGQLDGVRLLAPQSVALMATDHVDPRDTTDFAFGLGFQLVERLGTWGMRSVGTFGWGGAYGSSYWVDPSERMVVVFLEQLLPNRTDIQDRVVSLVYQALVN